MPNFIALNLSLKFTGNSWFSGKIQKIEPDSGRSNITLVGQIFPNTFY